MELRLLYYFLAVTREESISAAAEALHISQPALSNQLKALEQKLGKQLLIRGTKGARQVVLTEEGKLLCRRAQEIFELVQKTEKEILCSDLGVAGDVFIGAVETGGMRMVARAARETVRQYPEIRYQMFSGNKDAVLEKLDGNLIDLGILYGPVNREKYHAVELPEKDVFGVLVRRDSPLAQKAFLTPEDLWDQPLIVSAGETRDGWAVAEWLKRDISQLKVAATYNLILNAAMMVEEGLGCAFCLEGLVHTDGSPLCFRPLKPKTEVAASLVWKKYRPLSRAAEKLLEQILKEVRSKASKAAP